MVMRRVRTHVFQENSDLGTDHKGQRFCACCSLPEGHDIHTLEPQAVDVTEHEARRLGERNGER
jgi:hypothetical protein